MRTLLIIIALALVSCNKTDSVGASSEPRSERKIDPEIIEGYEKIHGPGSFEKFVESFEKEKGPGSFQKVPHRVLLAMAGIPPAASEVAYRCLTNRDGSHPGIVRSLMEKLRDPESYQHRKTSIRRRECWEDFGRVAGVPCTEEQEKQGIFYLTSEYRARNRMGGYDFGKLVAVIDPQTCNINNIISEEYY